MRNSQHNFGKERAANTQPRAKSMGKGRVEQARRNNGGGTMGRTTRRARGTNFVPQTNFVPEKDESLAERFSAVVLPFTAKQLAKVTGCSPETAKAWRNGRQFPHGEHIFKLARSIQSVRAFLYSEIEPSIDAPSTIAALVAGLQHVASQKGPDGDAARALLRGFSAAKEGDND